MICKNCGKENLDTRDTCMYCKQELDNKKSTKNISNTNINVLNSEHEKTVNNDINVSTKRVIDNNNFNFDIKIIIRFLCIILSIYIIFLYYISLKHKNDPYYCEGWSCFMSPKDPSFKPTLYKFKLVLVWVFYGIFSIIYKIISTLTKKSNKGAKK